MIAKHVILTFSFQRVHLFLTLFRSRKKLDVYAERLSKKHIFMVPALCIWQDPFWDKKMFENCILKTYFWSLSYISNQSVVGEHPGTIPVEFGQITISGSREDFRLNISLYNSM